jgi:hypothetical protein
MQDTVLQVNYCETCCRIIELERRWKETGQLEGRMEALEDVLKRRRMG